ncbi:hypothetical protein Tco_1060007 [Tanacetum coccineum]
MVHWVEIEAQEEHVGDKGRGKVSNEKKKTTYVDRGKEKLMDEVVVASDGDSGNEGMLIDSDDNDYYDKSYDYLSARKEELIELRTRKTNRSKTRPTPIPYTFSNDYTSRAKVANKREVFVEHEDFIDDLFRKLKGLDSDGNMQSRGVGGFGSGGVKGYDNPSFTSTQPHRRAFKRVGGVSFATRGGATSSEPCIRGYKKVSRRFARYFGTDGTTTTNTSGSQANASASQTEMYILSQKEIPSQATNELQMKTQNQSTRRLPTSALWSKWYEHFAQLDGHRIYQLMNDIVALKQQNCSIKKQTIVSISSTEAEYRALADVTFTSTQPHRRAFKRVGGVSFATRAGATSSEPCIRGYKKASRGFARYFGTDDTTTTNTSGSQANASASQTEMDILSQKEIPSQGTNELQMKTRNQSTRRLPSQKFLQRKLSKV